MATAMSPVPPAPDGSTRAARSVSQVPPPRYPAYVVVDLDFDTVEEAQAFLGFLTTAVWAVPASSPGLSGRPEVRVLETVTLP